MPGSPPGGNGCLMQTQWVAGGHPRSPHPLFPRTALSASTEVPEFPGGISSKRLRAVSGELSISHIGCEFQTTGSVVEKSWADRAGQQWEHEDQDC